MKRRNLLRTISMLPLLSGGLAALCDPSKAAKAAIPRTKQRVRPSDSAWPSAASWAQLKEAVGGNLLAVHSLFDSCGTEPKGAACLAALENIKNPYWVGDQPGGTQISGLLDGWTPAPSAYSIKARSAADVAAGVTERFMGDLCGYVELERDSHLAEHPTNLWSQGKAAHRRGRKRHEQADLAAVRADIV